MATHYNGNTIVKMAYLLGRILDQGQQIPEELLENLSLWVGLSQLVCCHNTNNMCNSLTGLNFRRSDIRLTEEWDVNN